MQQTLIGFSGVLDLAVLRQKKQTKAGEMHFILGKINYFLMAPRKISAFQYFCGHEKAANRTA